MAKHVPLRDLGAKIGLLLRSDRAKVYTKSQLSEELDVGQDYLSRLLSGSRPLTEEKFLRLCEIFKLPQRDWFSDVEPFGKQLGFTRKQVAVIIQNPLPGIDFASRTRDSKALGDLFETIAGYWESFYFAVSNTEKQVVSRDLCIIRKISEDEYIECEIHDGMFSYTGWCFPVKGRLYFILEKTKFFDEIVTYVTNQPDRSPPWLYGIMLCLSGGVEGTHTDPAAVKVVFRYIGRLEDEEKIRKKYGIDRSAAVENYLKENIPKYLNLESEEDTGLKRIFQDIANTVPEDAVPFALRMTK